MKALTLAIRAAAVIGMGLCGCAASTGRSAFIRNEALRQRIDIGEVVAVNRWAWQRGATVEWINHPTYPAYKTRPVD